MATPIPAKAVLEFTPRPRTLPRRHHGGTVELFGQPSRHRRPGVGRLGRDHHLAQGAQVGDRDDQRRAFFEADGHGSQDLVRQGSFAGGATRMRSQAKAASWTSSTVRRLVSPVRVAQSMD